MAPQLVSSVLFGHEILARIQHASKSSPVVPGVKSSSQMKGGYGAGGSPSPSTHTLIALAMANSMKQHSHVSNQPLNVTFEVTPTTTPYCSVNLVLTL